MTIWNGLTSDGAVVPVQVDDQGRVVSVGSGPDSPLVVDGDYLRPRDPNLGLGTTNINLDATGTAKFVGPIIVGDENNYPKYSRLDHNYLQGRQLIAIQDDAANNVFSGRQGGTETSSIKAGGSVKFTGQLQISSTTVGTLPEKVLLHENGWMRCYHVTNTPGADLFLGYSNVNGNGTLVFAVQCDGQINARSTSITQIGSERRLKNAIETIDPVTSWETIRDLPYYSYKLNGNDETTYYGPIVDECPKEMIVEGMTSDEEGNIRTYDNSLLQTRLYVALQTALKRIEALESQITSTMPAPDASIEPG